MSQPITEQEYIAARQDFQLLGEALNTDTVVEPRAGDSYKSVPMIVREIETNAQAIFSQFDNDAGNRMHEILTLKEQAELSAAEAKATAESGAITTPKPIASANLAVLTGVYYTTGHVPTAEQYKVDVVATDTHIIQTATSGDGVIWTRSAIADNLAAAAWASTTASAMVTVNSIAKLRDTFVVTGNVNVLSYRAGLGIGGGVFYVDMADTTSADNGCTVIVNTFGQRFKLQHSGFVTAYQMGCVCDGVTDDTVAFTNSASILAGSNISVEIYRPLLIKAISVPSAKLVASPATTLLGAGIYVPNMVGYGAAELIVDGKLSLNTSLCENTKHTGLLVTTVNNYATADSVTWGGATGIFVSNTVKKSVFYDNLKFNATVAAGQRGYMAIAEVNAPENARYTNIETVNIAIAIWHRGVNRPHFENIKALNFECVLWIQNPQNYTISNIKGINTITDAAWWCGKNNGVANNGKDIVMIEPYGTTALPSGGTIRDIYAEWAIERIIYIIATGVDISNTESVNGDGVKVVGNGVGAISKNNRISRVVTKILEDYQILSGKSSPYGFTTYWSENTEVLDSYIDNIGSITRSMTFAVVDGAVALGHAVKDFKLKRCGAKHTQDGLVLISMRNTVQAIDADYIVVDEVLIEDCWVEKRNRSAMFGPLFEVTDLNRDAAIKLKYAAKNVTLRNNRLKVSATADGQLDFCPYSFDYVDGFTASGTDVDSYFSNGTIWYQSLKMHRNVKLNEKFKFNTANIRNVLGNINKATLQVGSSIEMTLVPSTVPGSVTYQGKFTCNYFKTGQYLTSATTDVNVTLQNQVFQFTASALTLNGEVRAGGAYSGFSVAAAGIASVFGMLASEIVVNATTMTVDRTGKTDVLNLKFNTI